VANPAPDVSPSHQWTHGVYLCDPTATIQGLQVGPQTGAIETASDVRVAQSFVANCMQYAIAQQAAQPG